MENLNSYLSQISRYVETNKGKINLPYSTNFSFLSKYPHNLIKIGISDGERIDSFATNNVGSIYGGKLMCIFNDCPSPMELTKKQFIYLPENFNLAINGIILQNKLKRGL